MEKREQEPAQEVAMNPKSDPHKLMKKNDESYYR